MNDKAIGHKFLEDVNADFYQYGMLNDERQSNWKSERTMYGFDSRETWNLDFCFLAWFYERLLLFSECNNIDMQSDFEKHEIDEDSKTFQECVCTMIADCKYLMERGDFTNKLDDTWERLLKYFSTTIRSLWW